MNIFLFGFTAKIEDLDGKDGENRCITPTGAAGRCEDLSVCPSLLLDLSGLRDSLCFKRLFIPGVCCPLDTDSIPSYTTQRPAFLTPRYFGNRHRNSSDHDRLYSKRSRNYRSCSPLVAIQNHQHFRTHLSSPQANKTATRADTVANDNHNHKTSSRSRPRADDIAATQSGDRNWWHRRAQRKYGRCE